MERDLKLLGFNFTKILVEKKQNFQGKLEIKSNIDIVSVEKHKLDLVKQDSIKVSFSFIVNYGELGTLSLEGFLILLPDKQSLKEVLENWSKKLDPELRAVIVNLVIQKSSLQALKLEEEIGLPFHMQMPKVSVTPKKSD